MKGGKRLTLQPLNTFLKVLPDFSTSHRDLLKGSYSGAKLRINQSPFYALDRATLNHFSFSINKHALIDVRKYLKSVW